MQPGDHVEVRGHAPAVTMSGTGELITYRELDDRSKQLAQLLRSLGLRPGDGLALLLENQARYFEVYWAAIRCGLYLTPINWHLRPDEAKYILGDCGATALITSIALRDVAVPMVEGLDGVRHRLVIDGELEGFDRYEDAIAQHPPTSVEGEVEGAVMLYSSGTTGRPKGIRKPLTGAGFGSVDPATVALLCERWGAGADTVYLSPAPLYHAAPLGWCTSVQRLGGSVVVMERFDPLEVLRIIEDQRITLAQFVPTHFVRMLKLSEEERSRFDLSSLDVAVHAAAPCPVSVKEAMLAWWGPIIHEFYAGSEGTGVCIIGPEDWVRHPGSVGKAAVGVVHILDEFGEEQPTGQTGEVWFESGVTFEYHNDPEKTARAFNHRGWTTLGDIGHLDGEGYLYLTDRTSDLVISGGVNVYPREAENVLTLHPAVADVAVIGVPDAEMGEALKAVVQLSDPWEANDATAQLLIDHCRSNLTSYKCPRSVEFTAALPRLPNGKLLKRELRSGPAAS